MAKRKPMQLELVPGNVPAQAATRHQFRLDEHWIEYTVKRSLRRRSITFVIDADGLRVGAPWHASLRRIESLLGRHARWISRKLGEWRARRPPLPARLNEYAPAFVLIFSGALLIIT